MSEPKYAEEYPGVQNAFQFVIPSYQWMITRFEAVDSRIQTLLAFIVTVTFGIPAIVSGLTDKTSLGSFWFLLSLGLAATAIILGIVARSRGGIVVPSPAVMYDRWLDLDDWSFKKDAIYFAGQHFDTNQKTINFKGKIVSYMTVLFLGEAIGLVCWIISSFRQ